MRVLVLMVVLNKLGLQVKVTLIKNTKKVPGINCLT